MCLLRQADRRTGDEPEQAYGCALKEDRWERDSTANFGGRR
jgi:hypothetical protein